MWTTGIWRGWLALQVLALGACAVAWVIAADRIKYGEQVGLANISIAALAVSLLAHGWVLQQGRRRIGVRRTGALVRLGGPAVTRRTASADAASPPAHQHAAQVVVAGAEGRFYHRPGCAMAAGRDWDLSTVAQQQRERRAACRVCTP